VDPEREEHKAGLPGPSVWPIGVAVGVACILIGLIVSWWVVAIGAVITFAFGLFWMYELSGARQPAEKAEPEPAAAEPGPPLPVARKLESEKKTRTGFLAAATLGLGGVIGALVTVPPVFLALIPPFLKQGYKEIDIGPLSNYPKGQWMIATFLLDPKQGPVTRRTAYIRYNGPLRSQPSFTIISNRCAHLGCPVQPNGLVQNVGKKRTKTQSGEAIDTIPVLGVSGFSCPCHGGAYDNEGNRTAGPPVKGLDRYEFSIRDGRLLLGDLYSVSHVDGSGAGAEIHKYKLYGPGQHVDGVEQILYPFTTPS
jgi:quinol---cytochrome c reductase iron-sulfur subunit, bacillus type